MTSPLRQQHTSAEVIQYAAAPSLLDSLLEATTSGQEVTAPLEPFLQEPAPEKALQSWLRTVPALSRSALKQYVVQRLNRDIARLDSLLTAQVNAILHHPKFQKLEASWRSLRFLVEQVPESSKNEVKIKVLNVSWKELTNDLES